jgi:hypothetical protein
MWGFFGGKWGFKIRGCKFIEWDLADKIKIKIDLA